jgi:translation initiation factor 3 subunit J
VLESWDAAEDSEVEREKAKKAAEAQAKAEAAAKAAHKTKSQRIEERRQENLRRRQEGESGSSSEDEDETAKRARLRKQQQEADLAHAEDLFGDLAVKSTRSASKPVTVQDPTNAANNIDVSTLPIFNPNTKDQFTKLRDTLIPLITANSKKAHYTLFMQEFAKQLCKELPSDQVKKIASGLTTLSNEKMKEEKLAEKGGKKTKAKAKATLVATRDISYKADTGAYDDDGLDE